MPKTKVLLPEAPTWSSQVLQKGKMRRQAYMSRHITKPREIRIHILKRKNIYPVSARQLAVIMIQSLIRGHLTRNRVRARKQSTLMVKSYGKVNANMTGITQKYLRITGQTEKGFDRKAYMKWCAMKIQAWWRMTLIRRDHLQNKFPIYNIAASYIQGAYKAYRRSKPKQKIYKQQKAKIIQNFWRAMNNRKIFKYYKHLINFRNNGDPRQMLKVINPKEASLFDPAIGIHVRFRLGGYNFPPNLYYKIFTHNPICDVGSFAPRDYTAGRNAPIYSADLHNKCPTIDRAVHHGAVGTSIRVGSSTFTATLQGVNTTATSEEKKSEGWYQRYENNGWRPITIQVLEHFEEEPIAKQTRMAPVNFHYSKHQRQQEIERKRRHRKIKWMKNLYTEGMRKEKGQEMKFHCDFDYLIGEGKEYNEESKGEGKSDDWEREAEELLSWTGDLDYEKYCSDWKSLATTKSTSHVIENRGHYLQLNYAVDSS